MSGSLHSAATMPALVADRARSAGETVILRRKDRGIWKSMTWGQFDQRVRAAAAAVIAAGLRPGDVAAILSDTNPRWAELDLGIQAAGAVAAGLNPADDATTIGHWLRETGASLLFVEGEAMLDKALEARASAPALTRIVIMDMKGLRDLNDPACESMDAFLARGNASAALPTLDPDAVAVLILTAGTLAEARMVALSHRNIQGALAAAAGPLDQRAGDERLAFLPMCHAVERVLGLYLALATGTISNYVEGVDTVPENLAELQPTVLIAPPRFWRRLHARITAAHAAATPLQRWLLSRALAAGAARAQGRGGALDSLILALGERLILGPVRQVLGLSRLRRAVFAFGAAPAQVAGWLRAVGIQTAELYGQTEAGGFGFLALEGGADGAVRLTTAGEIQLSGPRIALGYRTAGGLAPLPVADGWLSTGDLGRQDGGRIVPAGRIAEGAGVSALEDALRASPFICDAIVTRTGDAFSALILIDPDTVEPWAQREKVPFTGFASLVRAEPVRRLITDAVATVGRAHGAIAEFHLLEQRLEPGDPELSPVFAPRRGVVRARQQAMPAAAPHQA